MFNSPGGRSRQASQRQRSVSPTRLRRPARVCGVFVTLNSLRGEEKQLRGCIGYPYPIKPLVEAVNDVAYAAAFEDPRFPRLDKSELGKIVIEVSVLTPPELIRVVEAGAIPINNQGWR